MFLFLTPFYILLQNFMGGKSLIKNNIVPSVVNTGQIIPHHFILPYIALAVKVRDFTVTVLDVLGV